MGARDESARARVRGLSFAALTFPDIGDAGRGEWGRVSSDVFDIGGMGGGWARC